MISGGVRDIKTHEHVRSVSGQKDSLAGDSEGSTVHPVSVIYSGTGLHPGCGHIVEDK